MTPTLTVAIPFFNEAAHLAIAVRSILAQEFTDFELLLLDDGSTDESLAIARSFASDSRVVVRSDGFRKHLAARLNEVTRLARGRYLARMDADDIAHPARFDRQLALLERSGVDAVGTWCVLFGPHERIYSVSEAGVLPATARSALEQGILAHATMLTSREWLVRHPYDEALSRVEDRDLWCRAQRDSTFGVVPEVLYAIRVETDAADFLAKYLASQQQHRKLIRRYGPAIDGWPRTLSACGASLLKAAVVSGAVRVGAAEWLISRRGRPPMSSEWPAIRTLLALQSP